MAALEERRRRNGREEKMAAGLRPVVALRGGQLHAIRRRGAKERRNL